MKQLEKNLRKSFTNVRHEIEFLKRQLQEIRESQKELTELLIKTKEEEDELINEVKEEVKKRVKKSSRKKR